ncbi:hypothetical protein C8Q70DRAFT_1048780 [Cubamyces menziesii]|nr:hypothetical protein C8Q70DRAFT_1048780 [Cubamyces menziesii]
MSSLCPGCNISFSHGGLLRHLRQTANAECIRYRQDRFSYRSPTVSDESADEEPEDDSNFADGQDLAPEPFDGDYFGSYDARDFEDFDEYEGADAYEELDLDADPPGDYEGPDNNTSPLDIGINVDLPNHDPEADVSQESDSSHGSDEEDADRLEEERSWEPPPRDSPSDRIESTAQDHLHTRTFVVRYPGQDAGAPLSTQLHPTSNEDYATALGEDVDFNPYAPFVSEIDWEFARWAKMRGPGSTAVTELLKIRGLVSRLGLSYSTSDQLNALIDKELNSGRPRFIRREVRFRTEVFEIYYRDIIACVRALFGDPEFAGVLVFAPERHFADEEHTVQVYFDMHTGRWWWNTQRALDAIRPGATIVPIIISSDKTQLTLFGSKTAYPVYMTIGNLPKDVRRKPSRRGQILLAYLPSTRLEHISSTTSRRRMLANLYHACLTRVLAPLKHTGVDGIRLTSGDGIVRRGHPIFAIHVGDYLEQILATGTKNGECPKCPIPRQDIGELSAQPRDLRNLTNVLEALGTLDQGYFIYSRACKDAGIKPIIRPYWADLPFVNIYQSITPDLLHQLYQGVIKHVISWLTKAFGSDEIDARCRRIPPNHNIRLFLRGITKLQRVTGKEHNQMCRFLLGLIIGLPLPGGMSPVRLVRAVRALLDFLFLAQYPAHSSESLELLQDALRRFHANKAIFVDLGIRLHFKLPKLHSLEHYLLSILLFGTTDNYDTQYTERLHIDFAKDAYRATNKKDEFPQMTTWLERREKVLRHEVFVKWRPPPVPGSHRSFGGLTRIKMSRHPSVRTLSFDRAMQAYGASQLCEALARFIVQYRDPHLTAAEVRREATALYLPFRTLSVFHRMKFILEDAQQLGIMEDTHDTAHARPERKDKRGRVVPGRFDTVLINENGAGGPTGIEGYRVGRIRLLFQLPKRTAEHLFPGQITPGHLAYVEWFSAFTVSNQVHGLYKVTRPRGRAGERPPSIIEIGKIRRSCHLYPDFGVSAPRDWSSSTVLDQSTHFWVSPFVDLHMYMTLF